VDFTVSLVVMVMCVKGEWFMLMFVIILFNVIVLLFFKDESANVNLFGVNTIHAEKVIDWVESILFFI
jgi:hypothetical protein